MYEFVDTLLSSEGTLMPSEALNFNGEFLENLVPGYRTLYVSGREIMESELTSNSTGKADGSRFYRKRYPSRTITVGYQLIARDNASFRDAYNKLNAILDVSEAKLIFRDEPDKFFVGTKQNGSAVPPGVNSATGEIEFFCADPFKYAVNEKTVVPTLDDNSTFVVNYAGTQKCFPILEAEAKADLGFVGFLNQEQKIIQIGSADELDGENYDMSQVLIDDIFTALPSSWSLNSGKIISFTSGNKEVSTVQTGTVGIGADRNSVPILRPSDYGTINVFGGPSITKLIPADANGHIGAKNWTFSWHHNYTLINAQQLGAVEFLVTGKKADGTKVTIASATYSRNTYGTKSWAWLYVNNKNVKSYIPVDNVTRENTITGYGGGRSSIQKFGGEVTFHFAGQVFSFTDVGIADIEATEISIFFIMTKGHAVMDMNGLYSVRFLSHSVESWRNVPNKFGAKDLIKANCRSGKIFVNGIEMAGLGALGNDWEGFCLVPGINQINCVYSSWAVKPEFKLKYREVYL